MTTLVDTIEEIAYHRNGVGGNSFYVVKFTGTEGGNMLGVVFDEPYTVAVFDRDLLAKGVIAFRENSWRGDHFEPELREAIAYWEKKRSVSYDTP